MHGLHIGSTGDQLVDFGFEPRVGVFLSGVRIISTGSQTHETLDLLRGPEESDLVNGQRRRIIDNEATILINDTQWFRSTENTDVNTGPLACSFSSFICLLRPAHFSTPLCCSLAHSLPSSWEN